MSRVRRDASPPPRSWRVALWVLAAFNVGLMALALGRGGEEVRDGAAGVTNGVIVAAGIAGTLLVAWLLGLAPLPARIVALARGLALGAQVLHAGGHLFRAYYALPWYDDALHAGLVALLGLLILAAARGRGFVFSWALGPTRVALLVWVGAVAAAGLWEVFEFLMDALLSTREQDDLHDTMADMLDGMLGGAVAAAYGWRAVRAEERGKALADARSDELLD